MPDEEKSYQRHTEADGLDPKVSADDRDLLIEIRENYDYAMAAWKDIREEATLDMNYIAGDPWDPKVRRQREDLGRPCVSFDELNQYCNQVINNVRQSKTSVTVLPVGAGANDKTAEARQGIIRQIEYDSKAQAADITAFENALQRSYGYSRVDTEYISPTSFEQKICVKRIPNPDTVLFDPDCKEADCSDATYCFVVDVLRWQDFKRKYPKAKTVSFTTNDMKAAPSWVKPDSIQIAEYWKVERKKRKLLLMPLEALKKLKEPPEQAPDILTYHDDGQDYPAMAVYEDELVKDHGLEPFEDRDTETREVCQYITNGIEILEEHEIAGSYIRIIPCFGKEIYTEDASGSKRQLISLVRLARDPAMSYAYLCSQEMEEAAMTPRVPYVGYLGQFEGRDGWKEAHRQPMAYLEINPVTDQTSGQVLPLPTRTPFMPNFQAYEMAKDGARRAIMSAMSISPLPTAAQRNNEKSGVALDRIAGQQALGSYHFVDNFHRYLEHRGRVINELIPIIYDTPREVGIMKPDDSHETIRVNDRNFTHEGEKEPTHYDMSAGQHDVTISTGPSYESQREEVQAFGDTLARMPNIFPQIADLLIRMRQLGPLGDEMADRLTPPQFAKQGSPQAAQAQVQQLSQQLQQMHAYSQKVEQELQKLQQEKDGKVADNAMRIEIEKLKMETQITIAEINTKAQEVQTRMQFEQDMWKVIHGSAHERALQADQQGHEQDMAQQQQAAASDQQAGDQAHEQQMAQQAQEAQAQQPQGAQP